MVDFDPQTQTAGDVSHLAVGKHAFEDLTDLQNDEFIVSVWLCGISYDSELIPFAFSMSFR